MKSLRLVTVVSTVLTVGSCGDDMGHAQTSAAIDQQFIDMMVPHHEGAVEMARIAQQRGEHAEVRTMADDVVKTQSAEMAQMKSWRMMWYGSDQTPPMGQMPMMDGIDMSQSRDMMAAISRLKTASPFDKAFIEEMVPHHQTAIAGARIARDKATRAEIRRVAEDVIRVQTEEIGKMQGWHANWYPGTPVPGIAQ